MRVEIMSEAIVPVDTIKKTILFTVTSSNAPYHWEYTSVYGNTGNWISFTVNA